MSGNTASVMVVE